MADARQKKASKLQNMRAQADADFDKILQKLNVAVGNAKRRVRVALLVTSCEEGITEAVAKTN